MATMPTPTMMDWVSLRKTCACVSKRRERPLSADWRAFAASSKTQAAAYAIQVRKARPMTRRICMRKVVTEVPSQSERPGLTRAIPSPTQAPQAAKVK
jgi:hypothetical protein